MTIPVIKKGLPTPVLTVCGKGTREIRFTRYLAYFLDPNGKHGLSSKFLKAVMREEAPEIDQTAFEHCSDKRIVKLYFTPTSKTG